MASQTEKHLNPYKYRVPHHRDRVPCTLLRPWEKESVGGLPSQGRPWVSSRWALPRRRGHLLGVRVLAKGVLLNHSGDLSDTPDLVSSPQTW